MESSVDDNSSRDSDITTDDSYCTQYEQKINEDKKLRNINVVNKIMNRQLYGRFAKHPHAKTEKIYEKIPDTCNRRLREVLPEWDTASAMQHIYMGFTICGQFLLSYTWTTEEDDLQVIPIFSITYYLCVWRYTPGHRLRVVSKHKIFRQYRSYEKLNVTFSQWPTDRNKVVAYGVNLSHPSDAYITVLFLPSSNKCTDCSVGKNEDDLGEQLPCLKHCVTIDFMLNITSPFPVFKPVLHLAYPDHIVINTGHYIHIINVRYVLPKPQQSSPNSSSHFSLISEDQTMNKSSPQYITQCFSDSMSDISEEPIDLDFAQNNTTKSNVVDAIIKDFSEYDLEGSECSKPFHELNISCEPLLNVTGKSYFNQHSSPQKPQTNVNQNKEKLKIAEKAYEFTEETEKCEKLSLFRKKRLADKKYEFSEDNTENIIPFQLLRQERRVLMRTQNRANRSPDYFVSPRSQGIRSPRSPMLSPTSRQGQSPSSPRNMYSSLRLSPGSCRSPISPRESATARKFNVYSPSHIDCSSDCSDNDSKLVLRQINNVIGLKTDFCETRSLCNGGLLIVDGKKVEEKPRWIRKVVKRFCNMDFENASSISDAQSRDEYICIDLPTQVHTVNNNQIDQVPPRISDEVIGPHVKVTQRTFDLEQFCQRRADKLCAENRLTFTHCEDYDIKIQHICPLSGDIICTAEIRIGAVKDPAPNGVEIVQTYTTSCIFVWNICTDSYRVMEPGCASASASSKTSEACNNCETLRLVGVRPPRHCCRAMLLDDLPQVHCKKVRVMTHNSNKSAGYLRDSEHYIQISIDRYMARRSIYPIYLDDEYLDSYQFSLSSESESESQ